MVGSLDVDDVSSQSMIDRRSDRKQNIDQYMIDVSLISAILTILFCLKASKNFINERQVPSNNLD